MTHADIIALLTPHHTKYRARHVVKDTVLSEWFETNYAGVAVNIAIHCLFTSTSAYCCVCSSPVKHPNKQTCSIECRSILGKDSQSAQLAKRQATMLAKYGVDNIAKLAETQTKRLVTMTEKYGALVSPATRESARDRASVLNVKAKQTLRDKYGVDNSSQIEGHGVKCKETMLAHYGVEHWMLTEESIQQRDETRESLWRHSLPSSITLLSITEDEQRQLVYDNPNQRLTLLCSVCDNEEVIPTETAKWRLRNTGTCCQKCAGLSVGSLKQKKLTEFIDSLNVKTVSNFRLSDNTQIDVFCQEFNIGFEFNGLFWHNDLRVDKRYHAKKTEVAAAQGITLIHIFEDEWDFSRPIVESRIRNLLRLTPHALYARQCSVKQVASAVSKQFLTENHIQGAARSSVALGLYHDNKLVSMMTFSKPSKAKGQRTAEGHWELLRFCSLLNTNVIGGASKLFAHFVKQHSPLQVLSFADKRWSTGKLYETLQFTRQKDTALNYWYVDNSRRIHRYALRKNAADDQQLTEYENRLKQGFIRIWDCGSSKWCWTKRL